VLSTGKKVYPENYSNYYFSDYKNKNESLYLSKKKDFDLDYQNKLSQKTAKKSTTLDQYETYNQFEDINNYSNNQSIRKSTINLNDKSNKINKESYNYDQIHLYSYKVLDKFKDFNLKRFNHKNNTFILGQIEEYKTEKDILETYTKLRKSEIHFMLTHFPPQFSDYHYHSNIYYRNRDAFTDADDDYVYIEQGNLNVASSRQQRTRNRLLNRNLNNTSEKSLEMKKVWDSNPTIIGTNTTNTTNIANIANINLNNNSAMKNWEDKGI